MTDLQALLKLQVTANKTDRREWFGKIGGEDVTLYATAISPYDSKMTRRKFPDFETSPSSDAMVALIVLKAETEDGSKAFLKGRDEKYIEQLPLEFTNSIAQALFAADFEEGDLDLDKLEKNS